eukprot:scaffold15157_cov27-Tisochrysis_lutea.AAC.1
MPWRGCRHQAEAPAGRAQARSRAVIQVCSDRACSRQRARIRGANGPSPRTSSRWEGRCGSRVMSGAWGRNVG